VSQDDQDILTDYYGLDPENMSEAAEMIRAQQEAEEAELNGIRTRR
jgi:hypothetical protein